MRSISLISVVRYTIRDILEVCQDLRGEKAGGLYFGDDFFMIAKMIWDNPNRQPQFIENMLPDQSGHLRFLSVFARALHRLK
jgi:hypothetical protein